MFFRMQARHENEKRRDATSKEITSRRFLRSAASVTSVTTSDSAQMEAGGIEPPSRDNPNGGLYMLIWCFDLVPRAGHQQSTRDTSRFYLTCAQRRIAQASPIFSVRISRTLTLYRRDLYY
jgi:hypothetical protein